MPRPQHIINTLLRDYTVVSKDPWVFEFGITPQEIAELRKPRALITGRASYFEVQSVKRMPGPPIDGLHTVQVTALRGM